MARASRSSASSTAVCLRLRGCCFVGLPRRLPSARPTRASSPFGPEVAAPRPAEPRLDLLDGLAAPGAGSPLPTPAASVARWAVPGLERRREHYLPRERQPESRLPEPRSRVATPSPARAAVQRARNMRRSWRSEPDHLGRERRRHRRAVHNAAAHGPASRRRIRLGAIPTRGQPTWHSRRAFLAAPKKTPP